MKFILIPYISLGFILSVTIGIEYNFIGNEMMPRYWGCPFVYKSESLGSSLQRYYSISGLAINIIIWSVALFFIDNGIRNFFLIEKFKANYNKLIIFLILFTSINIFYDYAFIGKGFDIELNYWYWNIDKVAKDWGGKYEGHLTFLKK